MFQLCFWARILILIIFNYIFGRSHSSMSIPLYRVIVLYLIVLYSYFVYILPSNDMAKLYQIISNEYFNLFSGAWFHLLSSTIIEYYTYYSTQCIIVLISFKFQSYVWAQTFINLIPPTTCSFFVFDSNIFIYNSHIVKQWCYKTIKLLVTRNILSTFRCVVSFIVNKYYWELHTVFSIMYYSTYKFQISIIFWRISSYVLSFLATRYYCANHRNTILMCYHIVKQ